MQTKYLFIITHFPNCFYDFSDFSRLIALTRVDIIIIIIAYYCVDSIHFSFANRRLHVPFERRRWNKQNIYKLMGKIYSRESRALDKGCNKNRSSSDRPRERWPAAVNVISAFGGGFYYFWLQNENTWKWISVRD